MDGEGGGRRHTMHDDRNGGGVGGDKTGLGGGKGDDSVPQDGPQ